MAGASDYLERAILRQLFRNTAAPQPTNVYVALWIGDPLDTGAGGAEVTGGSYARVAVSTGTATTGAGSGWNDPGASGTISTANNALVTFPTPSANWGAVTHIAIMDASSGGNQLMNNPLSTPRTINNGDSAPSFAIGALTVALD